MTLDDPRARWRHQRDKHGVVHRAWSLVRSRNTGELLWHAWCGKSNTAWFEAVPDSEALTCFWCLANQRKAA